MSARRPALAAAVVAAALGAVGCGGGGGTPADPAAPAQATPETTASTTPAEEPDRPPPTGRWSSGVVQVATVDCQGDVFSGTGFRIEGGLVLTAAHVVTGGHSVWVSRDLGRPRPATIRAVDRRHDVAVIAVPRPPRGHVFAVDRDAPAHDDEIIALTDRSFKRRVVARPGTIEAAGTAVFVERKRLPDATAVSVDAVPGMSGGAIVRRETGEVVGVLVATDRLQRSLATGLRAVRRIVERAQGDRRADLARDCDEDPAFHAQHRFAERLYLAMAVGRGRDRRVDEAIEYNEISGGEAAARWIGAARDRHRDLAALEPPSAALAAAHAELVRVDAACVAARRRAKRELARQGFVGRIPRVRAAQDACSAPVRAAVRATYAAVGL